MIQSPEKSNLPDVHATMKNHEKTLQMVVNAISEIEADWLDINKIIYTLLDILSSQFEASEGSIIIINEGLHIEHTCFTRLPPNRNKPDAFLLKIVQEGVAGQVIKKRTPYIVDDNSSDNNWLNRPDANDREPYSALAIPFVTRGKVAGVITLHREGTEQFSEEEADQLFEIANTAASHVENARLFAASQRQLQIAALLNEASRVINSSLNINEIMQSLLSQMNEFLNAEAISIALVDAESKELVYRVADGPGSKEIVGLRLPSNQGLSGWVMEHCQPALVPDTEKDPRFHHLGDERTGHATHAMICAPMQFKGEVLGTIQAINPIEGTFTEQDLDLLISLANIASTAIANANQFARTQAAEEQYASLFQDTINPIILTDLDGYITLVNRRATQILQYDKQELLGRHINELHEPESEIVEAETIPTDTVRVFTSKIVTKGQQKITVEVYAKRTYFEQSEILQWILHDISKHVELEEMRRDLTAMLFHDLQGPLGNIISSLELLSYEIPPMEPDAPLYYMLDIAKRSSERLQTLVRSLLDINRLEAGLPIRERDVVTIYDLISEIREIERPNFEQRQVEFSQELEPALPDIYIDEDMIRRVLINLVGNALKFSMEGQKVTLSASMIDDGRNMLISVSDQGTGIPVEFRQLIFNKFERIKHGNSDSKGLGLGLAFCRLAVEAHDGHIWVDDSPDGGARFNFTLPTTTTPTPSL